MGEEIEGEKEGEERVSSKSVRNVPIEEWRYEWHAEWRK